MAKRSSWWVKTWWEHDFDYNSFKYRKLNRHGPLQDPQELAAAAAAPQVPVFAAAAEQPAAEQPAAEHHDDLVMDIDGWCI